ncbi:hypothetical protein DV451_002388 [Geotrichum candidum]|uniref:Respiratory supercomplex factor 1, mitochondrial n=1 Tax=Geotrichum candidum TaxID=1173061 RepID=A0A9P5G7E5_GEOCN|nr:hypothetical protein DV451_002388 [Geotrichum candidum]KAF5110801.1 hypothetical protein DV453_000502 [Geotrichum candidum]KAF5117261.1 hypothetical protein DV454_001255 [Geotrichum candidum]
MEVPSSADPLNSELEELTFYDKIKKNCIEQPLVPFGCLLTCGALALSARATKRGDAKAANRMFVWRVAMQSLTLVALVGGSYYLGQTDKLKFDREAELRKKAEMREKMWLEELERIDEEAKERMSRAKSIREQLSKLDPKEAESSSTEKK